jgi:hypothetical protein
VKVLIACEFSGIVRDAFASRGHDAMSCDLLPTDKPGPHYQGDVRDILNNGWDMMIAHPPCTYLCQASNAHMNPDYRPYLKVPENRKKAVEFFMLLINAPIPKIAVENPIGCMSIKYRKPDQIIRPFMFGHPFRKDTCLWLKNLCRLSRTHSTEPNLLQQPIIEGNYRKKLYFWSDKRNPDGRSLKSITFQGIANAMAEQWG